MYEFCENMNYVKNVNFVKMRILWKYEFCENVNFVKMWILWKCEFCEDVNFVKMWILWRCEFCEDVNFVNYVNFVKMYILWKMWTLWIFYYIFKKLILYKITFYQEIHLKNIRFNEFTFLPIKKLRFFSIFGPTFIFDW